MRILLLSLLAVTALTAADAPGWSIERPVEAIPDQPLAGSIFGHQLAEPTVQVDDAGLTVRSGSTVAGWPAGEILIFVDVRGDQREWVVTPMSEGMLPHVHMKFGKEGADFPGTLMFTGEYSMRLHLDEIDDATVSGAIHLSLPDYRHSHLIGRFTARIE